jgi:aminopeptidase C
MARSSRHPREVRERAVALVVETQSDYGSQWEAIVSIAEKVGRVGRVVTPLGSAGRGGFGSPGGDDVCRC